MGSSPTHEVALPSSCGEGSIRWRFDACAAIDDPCAGWFIDDIALDHGPSIPGVGPPLGGFSLTDG